MKSKAVISRLVESSRRIIGNSHLSQTAAKLDRLLRQGGFAYSFIGGYAVQQHGYPRFTQDVDLVVRERGAVRQYLLASGHFKPVQGSGMTIVDRELGTYVDLLPAGRADTVMGVPYPEPRSPRRGLSFVSLAELIALKLSAGRLKDDADVAELIKANELGPEFEQELPAGLCEKYRTILAKARAEHAQHVLQLRLQSGQPGSDVDGDGKEADQKGRQHRGPHAYAQPNHQDGNEGRLGQGVEGRHQGVDGGVGQS